MPEKRVLVVEDERIVALDIKNRLESLGYEVCGIVHTGEDAVAQSGELSPDIVLMDIMLEGMMDGIEAARHIQGELDIPVIFLTAYSDEITIQRAKLSEPYGYILKPFEGRDIHTVVEMALYKHGMESRLKKMERWLSTTLKSIGDAVLATDTSGAVTFMNPVAEKLAGWDSSEVIGRELFRLITIIDELTHEAIEDPVRRVLEQGAIVQVYDSILMTRKGKGIPVKFSAAPIQDEHGRRTGVVLVINDISEQKRSAAETANTLSKLRSAMNSIIDAMAFTVETRDPYTAGHQRRVTDLARAIAAEMGLSDDEIDGIRMAGVIHDLGKISIPAEILSKPGKLSPIEFELIKTHPQTGYDILKNIEFPWPVAQIVYQHHEKLDGSGYPLGVSGSDILIESRVLTVADVVEAIASHRPYRAALGIEKSLEEIVRLRGLHFDAAVVDACVTLFNERGFQF